MQTFCASVVMDRKHKYRLRRKMGDIPPIAEDLSLLGAEHHDEGPKPPTFHPSDSILEYRFNPRYRNKTSRRLLQRMLALGAEDDSSCSKAGLSSKSAGG